MYCLFLCYICFEVSSDFQVSEKYCEVKSDCQNWHTKKLLSVKLKSFEHQQSYKEACLTSLLGLLKKNA